MTTYTPILNAEVDAESPITDLLLTRLRDNPIAIAAGDVGAPRIVAGGLSIATNSVSGNIVSSGATLRINIDRKAFFPDIRGNVELTALTGTASPTTPGFTIKARGNNSPYSIAWEYVAT